MATRHKDLRTGRPVWQGRRAPRLRHGPLGGDIETDVLVIGAGITGAMIADALTQAGLRVAVLDRRDRPASGSTVASTALVQYEIDTPLSLLAARIGRRDAVRAWRRSRLAVEAVAARLGELAVANVVRRDSLYLCGDVLDAAALAREQQARQAAGLTGRLLTRRMLKDRFGLTRAAALLSFGNLAIDPRKAALALLAEAQRNGGRLFAPAHVIDIAPGRNGVRAMTEDGRRVACRHLVFATGYEFPDCVPMRGHKIISTFAIATVAQPRRLWPGQCLIWEASEPYLYLRTTPEGRVVCGGEDEDFSDEEKRDALLPRKTRVLQRKLGALFPRLDTTIDFAWTGSFGQSRSGLPSIGPVPGAPRCWAALGYGGNGITYARIAADVITSALTGHPDIDADLYAFR